MKIWLDDDREAPYRWTRANTVQDVITAMLNAKTNVECVSLDYSLGISSDIKDQGVGVLLWLIDIVEKDPAFYVPEIRIHSGSASGRMFMMEQRDKLYEIIGREVIPDPSGSNRIWNRIW